MMKGVSFRQTALFPVFFFFSVVVVVDFVGIVVVDRGVSNLCPLVPTLRAMCVLFIEILPSLSRIAMNNS